VLIFLALADFVPTIVQVGEKLRYAHATDTATRTRLAAFEFYSLRVRLYEQFRPTPRVGVPSLFQKVAQALFFGRLTPTRPRARQHEYSKKT
jgi:hypothetical protein